MKKKISQRKKIFSFTFIKALLCTLLGLTFYIIGKKVIPFPEKWMGATDNRSLFFLGISIHLTVSWFVGMFFMFLDQEKYGEKIKKWRDRLSKIFTFLGFVIVGLTSYWSSVSDSMGKIALLTLILLVINCLIDALIQWMNKYGVCSGFSLLLFVEFLPTKWISETLWPSLQGKNNNWANAGLWQQPWFCMLLVLAITIFFIWIINLKWEVPIESNATHFTNNPLVKKHRSKLGFRMSFSFMHLYQLAQILGWFFILIKLMGGWGGANHPEPSNNFFVRMVQKWQWVSSDYRNPQNLSRQSVVWRGGKEGIGESFFLLNNKKRLFDNLFQWIGGWKGVIIFALLLLIIFRWLAVWFGIRKMNLRTKKISDDLKKKGVYINHLASGKWTRELLKKIVNRLVFFWFCIILLFNIVFDQIFTNLEKKEVYNIREAGKVIPGASEKPGQFFPRFLDWFGSIGIGIDLYRQIRTKYKYSQRN
ncbi:hypothetical protein [endosymbiont GvMRE of Glomus versiforme]|uniref:hypothetical protein n=1 Tax=endosymbiont GvMRE of Glomus versiforme TaxID=2039283 RepID=UPI000EDCA3A6|nr:hypothetical protein [endosymbiont GvMRE of Glomus versiforme]RHZ37585.1 hypothetical protein GvMRE_I1g656 [endosymbiont GvMRE of Glomus versiforme]